MTRTLSISPIILSICLFIFSLKFNMAQNPFYGNGNQTPPPPDGNENRRNENNSNNYDRYSYDSNNRYDSGNRYNTDRYDSNNRYNNDPYNRNESSNRFNDTNRYNDPYNRYNDPNNRFNDSNRNNDQYNRYNDPNSRYNNSGNRYNDPNNRYNDPNSRYNDPNSRYNDPSNRNNDPNNRYNDPNSRYNDPNNRYNDPNNRYNDPNNRYNQDPYNRYNQDQYNRYNSTSTYNLGSDLNPNYRSNPRYTPYNQDPNMPYDRFNNTNNRDFNNPNDRYNNNNNNQYNRNNDPNYNRYNQQNQYNNQNGRFNQFQNNNSQGQFNQQNRQQDSPFWNDDISNGPQYGLQNDPNDNCCEEYCYRTDANPSLYFGSKTAYQIVYGRRSNQDVPECTPIQLWSINRHGTRFPTEQEMRRLRGLEKIRAETLKNYNERNSYPYKGKLCPQDLDLLKKWVWNETMTENREKVLTSQGIEDAKFLARRFKSKFTNLLNQPYRENYYNFQYDTSDYKTHDTYQAYIEGLFDLSKSFMVHANTDMNERILPPSYCRTLSREVENNNYTYTEYERFKSRPEYRQMVRDVSKKLGFRYSLDEAKIRDMYDMCRYEKAWYLNDPSPWCIVFTKSQLELLEYAEDLQDYYYSGYGSPSNARVGCLLVKDMYEMMKKAVNGDAADAYKVSNYFTQSTQFLRFLTALGVARDNFPLTADNYYQQKNRQWKLSVIDPFGANLMAVLYNCQRDNKFKVMFLLNEVPVNFPECSVGLCDWNFVEQKLMPVAENCNREYCERGSGSRLNSVKVLTLVISIISVFYLM